MASCGFTLSICEWLCGGRRWGAGVQPSLERGVEEQQSDEYEQVRRHQSGLLWGARQEFDEWPPGEGEVHQYAAGDGEQVAWPPPSPRSPCARTPEHGEQPGHGQRHDERRRNVERGQGEAHQHEAERDEAEGAQPHPPDAWRGAWVWPRGWEAYQRARKEEAHCQRDGDEIGNQRWMGVTCAGKLAESDAKRERAAEDEQPDAPDHDAASPQPGQRAQSWEEETDENQRHGDADDGVVDGEVQRPAPAGLPGLAIGAGVVRR